MAYTALYRKYRPINFANVVGQDIVVKILKNSLTSGHISHAYLFSGPRGTGKTSIAKIFARAVNCENFTDDICGECSSCKFLNENDSDIIEIDAASNNGVDEIRTIRDNVKLLPNYCKYKIYIIDEVHMLSTGAFNALLKTLEEPPAHVIFILATTEPNKIPLTILSRCQRFDFSKIDNSSLINRLNYILESEDKLLTPEIVEYIAKVSDGGARDAINLLDQILSLNLDEITVDDIDRLSGKVSRKLILNIFDCLIKSEYLDLLSLIDKITLEGKNYNDIVNNMLVVVRDCTINNEVSGYFDKEYSDILLNYNFSSDVLISLAKILNELLSEIKNSSDQKLLFEIYMMSLIGIIKEKEKINESDDIQSNNEKDVVTNINLVENDKQKNVCLEKNGIEEDSIKKRQSTLVDKVKKIRINNVLALADKSILKDVLNDYDRINDFISNKIYNTISALLIDGKVVVASKEYLLFAFPDVSYLTVFDLNYKQIEIFLNEIYNNQYKVVAVTDKEWENIREEFIKNKKNNIPYVFIEENDVELEVSENNIGELENSALDIFGEDTISVK